ncbi:MAG: hypothetical protein H3C30_05695 [Candidatus Hydrogenedentes bacterium]|nr:hypothetical protein [Candidatus Hydrogenedentota bacterium]
MKPRLMAAVLFFLVSLCAARMTWAQTPERDTPPADPQAAESPAAQESSQPPPAEGDSVVLKNGKVLRGIRVVRVTPNMVELEYIPNRETMKIPRKQVTDIQYGNKAVSDGTGAGLADGNAPDVMLGEELSAEFHRKITAPVPDTPLSFENRDFLEILGDLAGRMGAEIVFEESVLQMPEQDRRVTITVPANTSLSTFFRREFREAVPAVKVSYEFEKIHVASADTPAPPPKGADNQ